MTSGDISWILTATALVMLMTPALGFFYGGLVRKKEFSFNNRSVLHNFRINKHSLGTMGL